MILKSSITGRSLDHDCQPSSQLCLWPEAGPWVLSILFHAIGEVVTRGTQPFLQFHRILERVAISQHNEQWVLTRQGWKREPETRVAILYTLSSVSSWAHGFWSCDWLEASCFGPITLAGTKCVLHFPTDIFTSFQCFTDMALDKSMLSQFLSLMAHIHSRGSTKIWSGIIHC